jgi:AraC-like DNA-binding protein
MIITQFCNAHVLTLAEADVIIVILFAIVVILLVLGAFGLHYGRILKQRNEQLRRILAALDEYREIVSNSELSLVEQEKLVKDMQSQAKTQTTKAVPVDDSHAFYVKMDARMNKEKPFIDPDFDYYALIKFMGVSQEKFCEMVPRYKEPDRTMDYINSLRAEYAARLLMEHSDFSMNDIAMMCGFRDLSAFISAFKFSFGIMPNSYLNSLRGMFKKKVGNTNI